MSSTKKINYIKEFNLCDRNHFQIVKGMVMLVALIAVFLEYFLKLGSSTPVTRLAMSLFAFCSGFGVSESFLKKKGLVHYWENKLVKVWIPSVVVVFAFNFLQTKDYASWIAQSPLGLKGNFLYLIFGGYVLFWLIFKYVENKNARVLCLLLAAAVAFAVIPEKMRINIHVFAFPVGVWASQSGWKRTIMRAGWGKKIRVLAICLAAAVGGWLLSGILNIPYVQDLILEACYLGASLSILLLTYYLQSIPVWGIFEPVGLVSYGMYLTYDIVFRMFSDKSGLKMYAMLFVAVAVASAALAWLRILLIDWNYKMRRKNRTRLKGSMT